MFTEQDLAASSGENAENISEFDTFATASVAGRNWSTKVSIQTNIFIRSEENTAISMLILFYRLRIILSMGFFF